MAFRISIITILAAMTAIQAYAQGVIGSIKIHPMFGNSVTKIIDTGSMVYYLSDNTLFSYDKDNDESDSYSRNNRLNDSAIQNIYYNYDQNYLVVVYQNSNIDILTDDGSTISMPDIYNAELQTTPTINDVTFAEGRILVATNFGYVTFNDERFEVEFSRNFGIDVYSAAATDNYLWVNADSLYYCSLDNPARTLTDMTATSLHESATLYPATGDTILFAGGWFYRPSIDAYGYYHIGLISQETVTTLQPTQNGFLSVSNNRSTLKYLDTKGNTTATYSLPSEMSQSLVSSREDEGQLWELSSEGIRHIQLTTTGGMTVLSDFYHPNASTVMQPYNLAFNSSTGTLLVSNSGQNNISSSYKAATRISTLDDGWWNDALPSDIPFTNSESNETLIDIYRPIFSPYDSETYFVGTRYEGAYQIKGTEVVVKYDDSNSPIERYTSLETIMCVPSIQFDASGNLWLLNVYATTPSLLVLPSNRVQSSSVTTSDWTRVNMTLPSDISFRAQLFITQNSDIKIVADGNYGGSLYFLYDNGDPSSTSIQSISYAPGQLYDQDGSGYSWNYLNCLVEDDNGTVWLGSNNGIITFNPANAFNSTFSATLPRISRDDGTNYADNLLDGTTVYAIAVDASNRKWIGTESNGLYLVNSDGSEVIKHYTTDNSVLPSNIIYSVYCATNSNSVFAGTANGVVEIYSDASQPSSNFNNVYAYPNPVRPGYSGDITIIGLMENSLVKIVDSSGNVVCSLQSLGGTAIWDGCNYAGKRVKTGVYFVLASQSDGSSNSGKVVTKILFIN